MNTPKNISAESAELRRRAEARLPPIPATPPELSPEETVKLLHELQTHQIELEMQNDELRNAQLGLIAARDRYSDLYDFAPLGYLTTDQAGRILEANLTLVDLLGLDRQAILQRQFTSVVTPEDQDTYYRHTRQALAATCRSTCQLRLLRENAPPFWAELDSILISDAQADAPLLRTIVSDISDRKQQDAENLALERQLLHTQKLESLGIMAGGIAHDFNNLLTIILANAELAMMNLSPDSLASELLGEIRKAGDRAAEIARQMLDYSGHRAFVLKPIKAGRLLAEMAHLLNVSLPKNAEFVQSIPADLPDILGAETQIRQVVMNLIINAAESLAGHPGTVTLSAGTRDCSATDIAISASPDRKQSLQPGRYVFLQVTDTGCGMDAATTLKIFDPFFTTKFAGRGLGMSALLGIMRGHRGFIHIDSTPGRGTSIRVFFPFCQFSRSTQIASKNKPPATGWKGSGKVLVVDDEDSVLNIGERMIQSLGFTVVRAVDGKEALSAFREHAGELVCVLLDLSMPHLGGEDTFREMHRLHPEIPVILTSGYTEKDATRNLSRQGLAGFLPKPYTINSLRDTLQAALPA
jgi:two-component system cell cycle sensor histidine kinase/response regulator CckA